MTPKAAIDHKKIKIFHVLFHKLGQEVEDAVRDEIEKLTGERSTKSLNNAQAWEILNGMHRAQGESFGLPIEVEWCPVYMPARAGLGAGNVAVLPSQKQVWRIYHLFRETGIKSPIGFLIKRFGFNDGEINDSRKADKVIAALENMKRRSAREGGRRQGGIHDHHPGG